MAVSRCVSPRSSVSHSRAGEHARQQVEREDPLGALRVAVDGEGDALGQERLVGFDLVPAEVVRRGGEQLLEERAVVLARRADGVEHLVVGAGQVVAGEQRAEIAAGRARGRFADPPPWTMGNEATSTLQSDGFVASSTTLERKCARRPWTPPPCSSRPRRTIVQRGVHCRKPASTSASST